MSAQQTLKPPAAKARSKHSRRRRWNVQHSTTRAGRGRSLRVRNKGLNIRGADIPDIRFTPNRAPATRSDPRTLSNRLKVTLPSLILR